MPDVFFIIVVKSCKFSNKQRS